MVTLETSQRWNHTLFDLLCRLLSRSILSSRFLHGVAGVKMLFLFRAIVDEHGVVPTLLFLFKARGLWPFVGPQGALGAEPQANLPFCVTQRIALWASADTL